MLAAVRQQLGELETTLEPIGVSGEQRPLHRLRRESIPGQDECAGAEGLDHRLPRAQLGRAVEHLQRPLGVVLREVDLPESDQALEVVGLGGPNRLEGVLRFDSRRVIAIREIHCNRRLGPQHLRIERCELAGDADRRRRLTNRPERARTLACSRRT